MTFSSLILTLIILTPLLGVLMLFFVDSSNFRKNRNISQFFSFLSLLEIIWIAYHFDSSGDYLQFVCKKDWVHILGIQYYLGVSGINVVLLILTALLVSFSIAVTSRNIGRPRLFFQLVLLTQVGLLGTFTAQNFFHWFLFWETVLIPAFFLVKLWGGADKDSAAMQFFVYTMFGSVFMFLGFQALYLANGTFNFNELSVLAKSGELAQNIASAYAFTGLNQNTLCGIIFFLVLLGFAVKIPLMPFHTWLPVTYTEAPSSVSILLTGLMSKMGMYGFLVIMTPIFPVQMNKWYFLLAFLIVLTVIASAWSALNQKDIKRMLAYSSINHLGYCMLGTLAVAKVLGITSDPFEDKAFAMDGVVLQMFNHGITAGTLFGFVALIELRSNGDRIISNFRGLRGSAPVFSVLFCIATFSSLGLPGLNGFISEFLIFKGAFAMAPVMVLLCGIALVLTALFLLNMIQTMLTGEPNTLSNNFGDLSRNELFCFMPFILLMFIIGVYPGIIINNFITPSVNLILKLYL